MRTNGHIFSKYLSLVVVLVAIMSGNRLCALAQGSVERLETTQEVKQPVDSSIRARAARFPFCILPRALGLAALPAQLVKHCLRGLLNRSSHDSI